MDTGQRLSSSALRVMRHYPFWLIAVMFIVIIILHYPQQLTFLDPSAPASFLGLSRHAVERVFLLVPITYASFIFGIRGGVASLIVAFLIMSPRVILVSPAPADALFESVGIIGIGALMNLLFQIHRREQEHIRVSDDLLKTEEEKWRSSFNALEDVMLIIGRDFKIENVNDSGLALLNKSREEVIGKKCYQTLEGLDHPSQACPCQQTLETGQVGTVDRYLERFDKHFSMKSSPVFNASGEIIKFVDLMHDITDLKNAEEMLSKITDGASVPSFVINKQRIVTHWNTAIASLSGIKKEEVIGTDGQWRPFYKEKRPVMADLIVDGVSEDEIEAFYGDKCRKNGLIDGAYEAEDFFPAFGEAGRWFHFTASPIEDKNGEIIGAIETLLDVTEQKKAEEHLRYYLKEITKAQEEERKRIALELHDSTAQSLIALLHQLENLLSSKTKLPVKEARSLWSLHERIRDVLQEVRRFSRDLRPSILDDLGLLPAVEWATGELKNEYGIESSLLVVGGEHRLSQEKELLLFRIVQEALSNIAKHAQASKAEVKVEFDENKIMLTISDDGTGFQLPESLKALPYKGKLGLAGMQERVQLLGGSLRLESELGNGTTIFIEAPA